MNAAQNPLFVYRIDTAAWGAGGPECDEGLTLAAGGATPSARAPPLGGRHSFHGSS